jgi:uncharacterized protein
MSMVSQQPDRLLAGWPRSGSPYHVGEQALQTRAGARDLAERAGRKGIRDYMPDQHRQFFAELSCVFIGSLDRAGRPWASILFGAPGFVHSPHDRRLDIAAAPIRGDPLGGNLRPGAAVGVLGIQLETRRRNRMNGRVIETGAGSFAIGVDQSFGNCPKYIQARSVCMPGDAPSVDAGSVARAETRILSAGAAALVKQADTFFVATASARAGVSDPVEGADVSHRGGRPGFVDVREENGQSVITAPDFAGNSYFSTFGNILLNPKAGLLFLDFATGDVLMLTGAAEVAWDAPELERFPGALRFLRVRVDEGLLIARAVPLRWSPPEPARQIAATGTWADTEGAVTAAAPGRQDMRIAIIGASGYTGAKITAEALARGHEVTGIVRNAGRLAPHARLTAVKGDATDAGALGALLTGHDVVISAFNPGKDDTGRGTRSIIEAVKRAQITRLVVVGGAGSLEVAPGQRLVDQPEFPAAWKDGALETAAFLDALRAEPALNWTFLSPPAKLMTGERTGRYRTGGEQLLTDGSGESRISLEDYAVAMIDEIERPLHLRQRFTVAY